VQLEVETDDEASGIARCARFHARHDFTKTFDDSCIELLNDRQVLRYNALNRELPQV